MSDENKASSEPAPQAAKAAEPEYRIERPKRRLTRQKKLGLATLLLSASALALWTLWPASRSMPVVQTSAVQEFQNTEAAPSFGVIEPKEQSKDEKPADFADIEDQLAGQREALETKNAALADEVERLQKELGEISAKAAAGNEGSAKEIAAALAKVQAQNQAMIDKVQADLGAQIAALKAAARTPDPVTTRQAADLAAQRAKTEEQLAARVASPSVVFDNGAEASRDSGALMPPPEDAKGQTSPDAAQRDFVQGGREASPTEASTVIAHPGNTVLQGTMIDATLENAVDSSLPGQLTAIVTRPVWSFDQSRVLIPAGSRLFGEYSSQVTLGQGRILVAWTRLVTPEGQSVKMEAFGGDAQGRSGITGSVNTRFGMRFGSAVLVSLLAAAPSLVASSHSNVSADAVQSVTTDLSDSLAPIFDAYLSLPPIISVAPGATVTVMVDRDLEIW